VAEFLGNTDFIPGQIIEKGVETALGSFALMTVLPVGTVVEVGVRSDDVGVEAAEEGNGRILSRQFLGIAYVYRIGLTDGGIVHSVIYLQLIVKTLINCLENGR
jgi:iron(III) transport system ATP-binding protein